MCPYSDKIMFMGTLVFHKNDERFYLLPYVC